MKNIFIVGSQGYDKNYGGWETFVKNFCDFYDKKSANIYVSEISDKKCDEYKKNGIICNPIYTKKRGSITMMIYSIKSLLYYIKYIKNNKIENSIIYILGLKMGTLLYFLKPKFKKYNIKVFVNPDGLEWKRSKWNKLVKKYFLIAEKSMTKNCDGIVCDAVGIKDYLIETYPKNKVPKYFIAYGATIPDISQINEKDILKKYNLKKNGYCLVVGRCVPENNIELIINEFKKSKIDKDLVIISNIENSSYYEVFKGNTKYEDDKRIKVLGSIYDKQELSIIRKNAYLYLHGHSVGGTNPSLLEAMSLTDLNLLFDCVFNKEVGSDTCLYFSNKNNNLKRLLDNKDLLDKSKKKLGTLAKKRIDDSYTWELVVQKYKDIFK